MVSAVYDSPARSANSRRLKPWASRNSLILVSTANLPLKNFPYNPILQLTSCLCGIILFLKLPQREIQGGVYGL